MATPCARSAYRLRALLENSLAQRGKAIAEATARAAFVPLSLEDREALARTASYYEGHDTLASLRILDDQGEQWASYTKAGAPTHRTDEAVGAMTAAEPGIGSPTHHRV